MGKNYYLYFDCDVNAEEIFNKSTLMKRKYYNDENLDPFEDYDENENENEINMKVISNLKVIHIGKRSFAGSYCYKCSKTLCKQGNSNIHQFKYYVYHNHCELVEWFDFCPSCGIDKNKLDTICSFSWSIFPFELENIKKKATYFIIKDEYSKEISFDDLLIEIKNECIESYDSIRSIFE